MPFYGPTMVVHCLCVSELGEVLCFDRLDCRCTGIVQNSPLTCFFLVVIVICSQLLRESGIRQAFCKTGKGGKLSLRNQSLLLVSHFMRFLNLVCGFHWCISVLSVYYFLS